uniref:Uncharacterized protein n=1 Tax=Kalanchoe fedtschenkoi TaxID=63787 RepID=A0A7N0U0S4_KALFE
MIDSDQRRRRRSRMTSLLPHPILLPVSLILISLMRVSSDESILGHQSSELGVGQRMLLSFKETPSGSNSTFDCSPNGPCVSCLYSEKSNPKFRCSETGYRIPLKCSLLKEKTKEVNAKNPQNNQSNTEDNEAYITYRSCIPAVSEDKLSVLGFEGIILCMLALSGSFVYYRKKQSAIMSASGAIRIPTSSRF